MGRRPSSTAQKIDCRPADALLIRSDVHIAWTVAIDKPTAPLALLEALTGSSHPKTAVEGSPTVMTSLDARPARVIHRQDLLTRWRPSRYIDDVVNIEASEILDAELRQCIADDP